MPLQARRACHRPDVASKQGVRDINFNEDGRKFVSSSYDKAGIKLWDTETGQVRMRGCGFAIEVAQFCTSSIARQP